MILTYLSEIFRRVFFPTTRGADYLSILLPLILAAAVKFAGVTVSRDASTEILAYLGAFTLATFLFRLVFTAPYSMWNEKVSEVTDLRSELSKPERSVMMRLVKHRAKARAKLAAHLEDLQTYAFAAGWEGFAQDQSSEKLTKIRRLEAEARLPEAYLTGRMRLQLFIKQEADIPNTDLGERLSTITLKLLQRHLMGDLTAESLALQLPIGAGQEAQQ